MSDPTPLHLLYTDYNKLTSTFINHQVPQQIPKQVYHQVPQQITQQIPQQIPQQVYHHDTEQAPRQDPQQVYVHLVCVEGKPFIYYEDEPSKLYPAFISQNSYYGQPRML